MVYGLGETGRSAGTRCERPGSVARWWNVRAMSCERIFQCKVENGTGRAADHLGEKAMQLAEIALGRRLVMAVVLVR